MFQLRPFRQKSLAKTNRKINRSNSTATVKRMFGCFSSKRSNCCVTVTSTFFFGCPILLTNALRRNCSCSGRKMSKSARIIQACSATPSTWIEASSWIKRRFLGIEYMMSSIKRLRVWGNFWYQTFVFTSICWVTKKI